jgi:hypothetical protein
MIALMAKLGIFVNLLLLRVFVNIMNVNPKWVLPGALRVSYEGLGAWY